MAHYPGARFYGGTSNGGSCSAEAASWHEAVTTGNVDQLIGWGQQAKSFHFAIGRYGDCGQGCDTTQSVSGVAAGNPRVLTIETWDDLLPATGRSPDDSHGPNDFPWDAGQCERIADMMHWMKNELGIPIRRMMTTNERGHAPHRLGVPSATGNVYVGFGPQVWTAHPGKECCGDLRILQLFGNDLKSGPGSIIYRALQLNNAAAPYLPSGPVNLTEALKRANGSVDDSMSAQDVADLKTYIGQVAGALQAQINTLQGDVNVIGARTQQHIPRIDGADPIIAGEQGLLTQMNSVHANVNTQGARLVQNLPLVDGAEPVIPQGLMGRLFPAIVTPPSQ